MNNLPLTIAWHNLNQQRRRRNGLIGGSLPPDDGDDDDKEPQWNGHCFWEILGLILIISFVIYMIRG